MEAANKTTVPGDGVVPEKALDFKRVDANYAVALSPVTAVPLCNNNGTLFLDMLDPKDLKKHDLISVHGRESRSYPISFLNDIRDVQVLGFFPSESTVAFLLRGTKDTAGAPASDRSPAGYLWTSYHNYVVEFNRDGSYKGLLRLSPGYPLSRFAVLPSGELLVAGYDQLNSAAHLLLIDSSGDVEREIDMPAGRVHTGVAAPYRSVEAAKAARTLIGSLSFTPQGDNILLWRRNSSDPILEVSPGGRIREVSIQAPPKYVFVEMIPANDRWVAHFRLDTIPEDFAFSKEVYAYYELRPQDASLSYRLAVKGDVPQEIACEYDGTYMTYKADDKGNLAIYEAK